MDSFDSPLATRPALRAHSHASARAAGLIPAPGPTQLHSSVPSKPISQVDRLRQWRHDAFGSHQYSTAEFIADKIVALTDELADTIWLAQIFYTDGNYARAHDVLRRRAEFATSPVCKYVAALSLCGMLKWDDALDIVGEVGGPGSDPSSRASSSGSSTIQDVTMKSQGTSAGLGSSVQAIQSLSTSIQRTSTETYNPPLLSSDIHIDALLSFLRGKIYTNHNNFELAKYCYQQAVKIDVKCYEAFDQLVTNCLMTPKEEWEFLRSLDFDKCTGETAELVKSLYTIRLGKYNNLSAYREADNTLVSDFDGLAENPDILLARADLLFTQCRYKECVEVCEKILAADSFKLEVMPYYLSCLFESGARNKLFKLAHEVVENYPQEPAAWLAVGTYYMAVDKVTEARRYFSKASILNPYYVPAWIAFAHTFAQEGELEQAISAYSTAARLFPGTHQPPMYLGMQHLHLHNLLIAEEYLMTSFVICKSDPLLLNELGVVHYHKQELAKAEAFLLSALEASEDLDADPRTWKPVKVNLGHVYRKAGQFEKALSYFEEVSHTGPSSAAILTSIALVNLEMKRYFEAIRSCHDALSISPSDPVATQVLNRAVRENAAFAFVEELPDEEHFQVPSHLSDILHEGGETLEVQDATFDESQMDIESE